MPTFIAIVKFFVQIFIMIFGRKRNQRPLMDCTVYLPTTSKKVKIFKNAFFFRAAIVLLKASILTKNGWPLCTFLCSWRQNAFVEKNLWRRMEVEAVNKFGIFSMLINSPKNAHSLTKNVIPEIWNFLLNLLTFKPFWCEVRFILRRPKKIESAQIIPHVSNALREEKEDEGKKWSLLP